MKLGNFFLSTAAVLLMGVGFMGMIYILEAEEKGLENSVQIPQKPVSEFFQTNDGQMMARKADETSSPYREDQKKKNLVKEVVNSHERKLAARPVPEKEREIASIPESVSANMDESSYRESNKDRGEAAVPVQPQKIKRTVVKVAGPLEDSAEIALINASLTLPDAVNIFGSNTNANNANTSLLQKAVLKPKLMSTGKAFGGFTEGEFRKRELRCMAIGIYHEARGEPVRGQTAVAQVIMNRVRSPDYPDTICGVIFQGDHRRTGCQFSFACDGKTDRPANAGQWAVSRRVAKQITDGKIWMKDIGFSTHYHATYVNPYWKRDMRYVKKIGRHIFYKAKNVSVTDTFPRVRG